MLKASKRFALFEKAFWEGAESPSPGLALPSFAGSATAFAAAALARGEGRVRGARPTEACTPFVLAVTPGLPEADAVADDLRVLEGECGVRALSFPPPLEDDPASTAARLKVSAALGAWRMPNVSDKTEVSPPPLGSPSNLCTL